MTLFLNLLKCGTKLIMIYGGGEVVFPCHVPGSALSKQLVAFVYTTVPLYHNAILFMLHVVLATRMYIAFF